MKIFKGLRWPFRDRTPERKLFQTIMAGLVQAMPEHEPVSTCNKGNTGCCCADSPSLQRTSLQPASPQRID